MKTIVTTNPYNGEFINKYELYDNEKIKSVINLADDTFSIWKEKSIKSRIKVLKNFANELYKNKQELSELITLEMGKPITEGVAEIEKCILLCDFYIKNSDRLLADELIETDADESFVSYDPLGIILAIMPWNYPFWQVLRFAIPTLTAGNTAILKHATNVTGCALRIQELFETAGYPKGCFNTVLFDHDQLELVISDERVKAVTLTGSEKAGRAIAALAGKNLKKTVLELGGNNACIVFKDADLDSYLETMVKARMQNTGQSCIAAKRFIVVDDVYDTFLERFKKAVESINVGDPTNKETELTVLARPDLAKALKDQVDESVKLGAKVLVGNSIKDAYFAPTILTSVRPGMPVFDDETFGPVAAVIRAKDDEDAIGLAMNSKFGLGCMLFTQDTDRAVRLTNKIEDGAFFINDMVKSDPRLPFGGTKASGYGRELSREGILEFVNKKTVYIKN